jgi:hypothetical protein
MTTEIPDNLILTNGVLSTKSGEPLKHYLNGVYSFYVDEGPKPMVLVTKRYYEELVRKAEAYDKLQEPTDDDERFLYAA